MEQSLTAFLARTWEAPFVWGSSDCTLWVADWCVVRWTVDPAASFRSRYTTQAEAEMLIEDGLAETIRPFMRFAVEKTADAAEDGDVGVVLVDGKETGAIRTGGLWAIKTAAGTGAADFPAVAIWGD